MVVDSKGALISTRAFRFRALFAAIHSVVVAGLAEVFIGFAADKHGHTAAVLALEVHELIAVLGTVVCSEAELFALTLLAE